MSEDNLPARRGLTFSQAEGLVPLPRQLQKESMPAKLRARLWEVFDGLSPLVMSKTTYKYYLREPWNKIASRSFVELDDKFSDEVPKEATKVKSYLRSKFKDRPYHELYDFIQICLQEFRGYPEVSKLVNSILTQEMAAYRVFDLDIIAPISSDIDIDTINNALSKTEHSGAIGSRAHLKNAISLLNSSDFSGSVRESISAVESVAKVLSDDYKTELSRSLAKLEKSANIHGGMRAAFNSLYGYTSDEKGVRHSLLFADKANVDETDALFMIGSCSSFIAYLLSRAADAGISIKSDL